MAKIAMLLVLMTEICSGAISHMAAEGDITYDEALCQVMAVLQSITADNRRTRPCSLKGPLRGKPHALIGGTEASIMFCERIASGAFRPPSHREPHPRAQSSSRRSLSPDVTTASCADAMRPTWATMVPEVLYAGR